MSNFKYGWKPSGGNFGGVDVPAFKQTDALKQAASANYANQYVIDTSKVPTHDQGSLSACVAYSTTTALEILQSNNPGATYEPLSQLFTYYQARIPDNDIGSDQGCMIHNAFNSLKTLGVCSLSMWDGSKSFSATPSILAYKESNDNTISSFHEITSDGNDRLADIEISIRGNLAVVWGTAVGDSLENYTGSNTAIEPPKQSQIKGLHATVLVGVRDNNSKKEFCLLNSWGPGFGQTINGKGGFCWVSSNYILNKNSSDFFVAEAMTNLLK